MVERPDKNASPAEIAEWMEQDFWEGVADSIRSSAQDDKNDD
jgi:hypothetical protein